MAKIFKVPFASQGDKTPIPDAAQGDGSVSYNQGFGFDYERPYEDPQSKDIPREGMNQIFNDLSGAVGEIQAAGVAQWSPDADPYPIGALVWRNNQLWQSTAALNAGEPGVASGWSAIDAKRLRDATESVKGVAQVSTQAQVNAGTDDATIVTPKKLRAGFSASFGTNGYLALPTWMGGLIFQWGRSPVINAGSSAEIILPLTFPGNLYIAIASSNSYVADGNAAYSVSVNPESRSKIKIQNRSAVGNQASASYFCVGD